MIMNKLKYIFPALFFLVVSCNKDDCDEVVIGEPLVILESSRIHLSSYFDSEQVIFINSMNGEEVVFQITEKLTFETEYRSGVECEDDPSKSSQLIGTAEIRQVQIQNTSLGITITLQHQSALRIIENSGAVEQIFILEGELNDLNQIVSAKSGLLVVTPTVNDELFTTKTDTLNILGREFLDVEETNPSNTGFDNDFLSPNLSISYTENNGIIYIYDELTNSELVFERIE